MKLEFSGHSFEKYSNVKFHENTSSASRVVPCGQTDRQSDRLTDWQTGMTKLTVAFRNFANAPNTHEITLYILEGVYCMCHIWY
jgi:hypothetical protein